MVGTKERSNVVCSHRGILEFLFQVVAVVSFLLLIVPAPSVGQVQIASDGQSSAVYSQLRTFSLASDSATVENLILQRDRVVITFVQGTFYFAAPVAGKVRGAVFIGTGNFHSDLPPDEAERANVRRLLKADDISSDFKTAVFQFTDDTYDFIGKGAKPGAAAPPQAQRLATELLKSLLEEEGLNLCLKDIGIHPRWRRSGDLLRAVRRWKTAALFVLV